MEMTLDKKLLVVKIQYVLEYLIEQYNSTNKPSDKFKICYVLLEHIQDERLSLDWLRSYMDLDKEKFLPFINLLDNVSDKFGSGPKEQSDAIDDNIESYF